MTDDAMARIEATPATAAIVEALRRALRRVGPCTWEAKKTSIHVVAKRGFLGLHPRAGGLLVNVVTEQPIRDPRVRRSEQVSKNRAHNEILLTRAAEVDDEFIEWIGEAYRLATGATPPRS